jgi:nucleoside-diphosphate-sugar epimerase
MRVFVIGATGYIGREVTRRLRATGHETIGLARTDAGEATVTSLGATPVRGSVEDQAVLLREAGRADATVYVVSLQNAAQAEPAVIEALLGALANTGKAFIYTSGVWVQGDTHGRIGDEDAPLEPIPLVAWRLAVENTVLAAASRGIRTIVVRPGVVYGGGGGIPAMLTQSAREHGAARYVGTGGNRWAGVHLDDLADAYVRAVEVAPARTLLNVVDGRPYVVRDVAAAASEGAGAKGRTESWPLEDARKILGPFADALAIDQQFTPERARHLLSWSPKAPSLLDDLRTGSYATH